MRLPPAPVHGAEDLESLPKQRLQAIFFPEGLTFDGRNLELHQHVWLSNSCERIEHADPRDVHDWIDAIA